MKKLKTLKDIWIEPLTTIDRAKEILREEAVKWVKEENWEDWPMNPMNTYEWIKTFFNLTEKDLK